MTRAGHDLANRLPAVAAALAIGIGSVMVMRIVARRIAGAEQLSVKQPTVMTVETGANAPKTYDLGGLIPGELRYSVIGQRCRRTERRMLMPLALARKTSAAEAEGLGWTRSKEIHESREVLAVLNDACYYETPDGRFVSREFQPESPEVTRLIEIDLPSVKTISESLEVGEDPDLIDFFAIVSATAPQLRAKLPSVLLEIVPGLPVFMALHERVTGHVFQMSTVERSLVGAVERNLVRLLSENGWYAVPNGPNLWQKANLTLTFECCTEMQDERLTTVHYRISDDEVRINKQRSE